ncbi:MAG: M15 family metallopeptidase [Ginsengibacter sp.]
MKQFIASNFKGDCTIDEDFEPALIKMNEIAQQFDITVQVNSSFRIDANVKGAIVTPATHSNHMIGHAIDCNLVHEGAFFNSTRMQSDTGIVRQFINELKAAGIRWGGDFGKPDPVHFDDGLNIKDMIAWTAKFNKLHGIGGNANIA